MFHIPRKLTQVGHSSPYMATQSHEGEPNSSQHERGELTGLRGSVLRSTYDQEDASASSESDFQDTGTALFERGGLQKSRLSLIDQLGATCGDSHGERVRLMNHRGRLQTQIWRKDNCMISEFSEESGNGK